MNAIPSLRTRCPRTRTEPRANARGTSVMGAAWFSGFGDWLGGLFNGYGFAASYRALPESFRCKR